MSEAGSIYILDSENTYHMVDENTYLLDTIPLPTDWTEGRAFDIKPERGRKRIERRARSKTLTGRGRVKKVGNRK